MAAAGAGAALACEPLAQAVMYLGLTQANVATTWDPELAVPSGSVLRAGAGGSLFDDLFAIVQRTLQETARTRVQDVRAPLAWLLKSIVLPPW